MNNPGPDTTIKKTSLLYQQLLIFSLLFIFTFPFPGDFLSVPVKWMEPVFSFFVSISSGIFRENKLVSTGLLSDTIALNIHVVHLLIGSVILSFLFRKRIRHPGFIKLSLVIIAYYLALQMLGYGFNKVFKHQFFLPEPNTLYTAVGNVPRDLLYWTVMGTSHPYNIFMGLMEITAGALLLSSKTRLAGSLLAFGIMLNVVMVNFCFDISVKIYSLFLLLLPVLIFLPDAKRMFRFFFKEEFTPVQKTDFRLFRNKKNYYIVKILVLALIFTDTCSVYFITGNFNGDQSPRPLFHGAWEVQKNNQGWKRVFVHRDGYFIIQAQDDKMHSFILHYDIPGRLLLLENELTHKKTVFPFMQADDHTLLLEQSGKKEDSVLVLKKLRWQNLPLLQNEFHWAIDGM